MSPKKLIKTKKNCRKVSGIIFRLNFSEFLKFFNEKKIIIKDEQAPKTKA